MKSWVAIVLCFFGIVATCAAASLKDVSAHFSEMYVAPMAGASLYRLYAPDIGMVEFKVKSEGGHNFAGPSGWSAQLEGDSFVVWHRPKGQPAVTYRFVKGCPESVAIGKERISIDKKAAPSCSGPIPELWNENLSDEEKERIKDIWRDSGRLRLFYRNPNRAATLLSSLVLLLFAFALYSHRRWMSCICAAGFAGMAWLQFLAGSRSMFLASFLGCAFILACRFRNMLNWRRSVVALGVVVALVALFLVFGGWHAIISNLGDVGNLRRVAVFQAVPRMLADAPSGWGDIRPGRAYMDWYQPMRHGYVTWTLISGHFTVLASIGWPLRFAWVLGWLVLLALFFRFAIKGGSPVPFVIWAAFAFAALINPILSSWSLWVVPVASIVPFVMSRPWRVWRDYLRACIYSVALSIMVVSTLWGVGRSMSKDKPPSIRVAGNRVLVNGEKPKVWVVDDEESLGWVMASKDIRAFYQAEPQARALGYVRSLGDVPKHVKRLVLAGKKCGEYIEAWKQGRASSAEEILLLSPGIAPTAIPPRLRATSRVGMVVGEFALRYHDVYGGGTLPKWVATIPGAEVYLPGWVSLAVLN